MHPTQFAYRKGLSTAGPTILLHDLAKRTLNARHGRKLYTAFIDFTKAFDSIERGLLSRKLKNFGLPASFVDMIIKVYNTISMSIQTNNSYVGDVRSNIGVFQGCPLAALLFNCFLADLAPEFKGYGPSLQGERIPCLSYADDLAIMAESTPELKKMLSILEKYCETNKLKINTNKTL